MQIFTPRGGKGAFKLDQSGAGTWKFSVGDVYMICACTIGRVSTNQHSETLRNTASYVSRAKTWFLRMCECVPALIKAVIDDAGLGVCVGCHSSEVGED